MEEKRQQTDLTQNIVLESRKKLTASSVKEVDSFNEQNIVAFTSLGELTVTGANLHIGSFSTDTGELIVEGEICSVSYSDDVQSSGGFFSRIFR